MTLSDTLDEIRGLDIHDVGSWPLYARVLATVLVCLLVLALGAWFMIKPKIETLHSAQAREVKLKTEFETKQQKVAALDAYKAQLETMRQSFGTMLRQLPSKSEVANLLNDIEQTRVASGLAEELFKPTGEVEKEFYAELPNQIRVVGSYHELGTFVSDVAALSRIVTVENVEIKLADKKDGQGSILGGHLRMDAVLKTYRYLDEDSGDTAPEGKSK